MSKYIIEIAKEYEEYFKGVLICGIADGKFAVDVIAREDLEELNSDYINENFGELQDEAYKCGYEDAERIWRAPSSDNEFYQKGFEDGKNIIDKGCKGCKYESRTAMEEPCQYCSNCHTSKYTPMPEKKDRIEVGDIVEVYGNLGVVTYMYELKACVMMIEDGSSGNWNLGELKKTGKHYDIQSILEAMRK